jgi:calcineurin-like phosphoesterase
MRPQEVIRRFRTKRPFRYDPAKENPGVSYVVIRLDPRGKAASIQRFRYTVSLPEALLGDLE